MAVEAFVFDIGIMKAGADLSAKQYFAVEISADFTVVLGTASDVALCGILQNKPTSGHACKVRHDGISKAVLGADSITAGMKLTSDAAGKLVEAATKERYLCICLEGGDTDDVVSVLMESGIALVT